jgi:hypothetical protein
MFSSSPCVVRFPLFSCSFLFALMRFFLSFSPSVLFLCFFLWFSAPVSFFSPFFSLPVFLCLVRAPLRVCLCLAFIRPEIDWRCNGRLLNAL